MGKWDQVFFFFFLFPNPELGRGQNSPSRSMAAKRLMQILLVSMVPRGGLCQLDPPCPIPVPRCGNMPIAQKWAKLSLCQLPQGYSAASWRHYLWGYVSKPGGLTVKILAISATLGLCLRSHFCSCACLHLILFALTSMQMQQQAHAVTCSLYYDVFSLLNHGWFLMIELHLQWKGAGCFNSVVATVLAYSMQIQSICT